MVDGFDPEELKQAVKAMFMKGGTTNVLDCLIVMSNTQTQLLMCLKELLNAEQPK